MGREWIWAGKIEGDLRQAGNLALAISSPLCMCCLALVYSLLEFEGEGAANLDPELNFNPLQLQALTNYLTQKK